MGGIRRYVILSIYAIRGNSQALQKHKQVSRIRFRDLHRKEKQATAGPNNKPDDDPAAAAVDSHEDVEDIDRWLDEEVELADDTPPTLIEVSSLVDTGAPEVEDCLSDVVPPRLVEKQNKPNGGEATKATGFGQGSSDDTDWSFV